MRALFTAFCILSIWVLGFYTYFYYNVSGLFMSIWLSFITALWLAYETPIPVASGVFPKFPSPEEQAQNRRTARIIAAICGVITTVIAFYGYFFLNVPSLFVMILLGFAGAPAFTIWAESPTFVSK